MKIRDGVNRNSYRINAMQITSIIILIITSIIVLNGLNPANKKQRLSD